MNNFQEINHEIAKTQALYESKAMELISAQRLKEEAQIALIRVDSTHKCLRLEVSVVKSKIESLREQSFNLRKEASI